MKLGFYLNLFILFFCVDENSTFQRNILIVSTTGLANLISFLIKEAQLFL